MSLGQRQPAVRCSEHIETHQVRVSQERFINYSYVVIDRSSGSGKAALIDPAWEPETLREVCRRAGARPSVILITHAHWDHTNLADILSHEFKIPVLMSAMEVAASGFSATRLDTFDDGSAIPIGGSTIRTLVTPGHTRGSACFLTGGDLFTGDTVFMEGVGVCEEYHGAASDMFRSVRRLRRVIPPQVRVFPGHRYGLPIGLPLEQVLLHNFYFCIEDERQFVDFRMRRSAARSLPFL